MYSRLVDGSDQKEFVHVHDHSLYHYEMFNLHAHMLHVKHIKEASHTAEMVLEESSIGQTVFKIVTNMYHKIIVVSDSDLNYCDAKAYHRLSSGFDHKLKTVMMTVLNKMTKMEYEVGKTGCCMCEIELEVAKELIMVSLFMTKSSKL